MEGNISYVIGTTTGTASCIARNLAVKISAGKTRQRFMRKRLELMRKSARAEIIEKHGIPEQGVSANDLLAPDEGDRLVKEAENTVKLFDFLEYRVPLIIAVISLGVAGIEAYLGNNEFAKIAASFAIPHLAESLVKNPKK